MDLLNRGAAFLAKTMKARISRTIIYKRGSDEVSIEATLAKHPFIIESSGGQMIEGIGRDYLFLKADLVLATFQTVPERHDMIEDGADTYEVMNPVPGNPEWRYNDSRENQIRVHTKKVGE